MPALERPHVVVFGGCLYDLISSTSADDRAGVSNPTRVRHGHGGAGRNVAENLARLGCAVTFVTVVGDDPFGDALVSALARLGVDVRAERGGTTGIEWRRLASDGSLAAAFCDPGPTETLGTDAALAGAGPLKQFDCAVLEANLNATTITEVASACASADLHYVLEPVSAAKAERVRRAIAGASLVKPNQDEAEILTGLTVRSPADGARAAARLRDAGAAAALVSLGADGFWASDAETDAHFPALEAAPVDVTGAGDALLATAVARMATGEAPSASAAAMQRVAALACQSHGAVNPQLTPDLLWP